MVDVISQSRCRVAGEVSAKRRDGGPRDWGYATELMTVLICQCSLAAMTCDKGLLGREG